jgi:hypothetical protein
MFVLDVLVRLFGLGWWSFRSNGWNMFDFVVASGNLITTRFGNQQLQKIFLVCIAFKLVQRSDALNKLFKIVV